MGKKTEHLTPDHIEFIKDQKIFFVGTAAESGRVNISPKGMDTFHVLETNKIVWLNLTGSGNETAAHLLRNNRMTIMFCAFEGTPMILRLYGQATVFHPRDTGFNEYIHHFRKDNGNRQIIVMDIDLVQSSCGFAVPLMAYVEDRKILTDWAEKKGPEGIETYWKEKNLKSIDGFDTNIL